MSALRTTTAGATTASHFSSAVGTPKLTVRVGAAAIPGTNSAGGKPRPLRFAKADITINGRGVRIGSKADITLARCDVCFHADSRHYVESVGNDEAKAALKRIECPYVIKDKQGKLVTNLCF